MPGTGLPSGALIATVLPVGKISGWLGDVGAGGMPGTGLPSGPLIATVSPMAKISGWLGTVRSGRTCRRPARSAGAPSHSAAGEARTPAAQTVVLGYRRLPP